MTRRTRITLGLGLGLLTPLLGHAALPERAMRVRKAPGAPRVPLAGSRGFFGLAQPPAAKETAREIAAFAGWLSPLAVPSPDGQRVYYGAWEERVAVDRTRSPREQGLATGTVLGRPSLRVQDLRTGTDTLLEDGAYSLAVRRDGALAYVRGTEPDARMNVTYRGDVVVRRRPDAAPEPWTTEPDYYVAAAWAGKHLVFYRLGASESATLLVADGPGRVALLREGATLVAVSPDGALALVEESDGRTPARVSAIEVATGAVRSELVLPYPDVEWLSYAGAWVGDRVVARASPGLVVLRVDRDGIALDTVLRFSADDYPRGVQEPVFTTPDGHEIAVVADAVDADDATRGSHRPLHLVCDRDTGDCTEGSVAGTTQLHPLRNPSRPE